MPQLPPVLGPAPHFQPPPVNIAHILGQLSSTPPIRPLHITPYAPENVGPLAMPGAGLQGAQTALPPWTGGKLRQPQQQSSFGGSVGGMMQPRPQGGRDDRQQMTGQTPFAFGPSPFGPSLADLIRSGQGGGRW